MFSSSFQESFQAKDYLNMRYHYKRALYLTALASRISKAKLFDSIKFVHLNGELNKPILLLKPKGSYFLKVCTWFIYSVYAYVVTVSAKVMQSRCNTHSRLHSHGTTYLVAHVASTRDLHFFWLAAISQADS